MIIRERYHAKAGEMSTYDVKDVAPSGTSTVAEVCCPLMVPLKCTCKQTHGPPSVATRAQQVTCTGHKVEGIYLNWCGLGPRAASAEKGLVCARVAGNAETAVLRLVSCHRNNCVVTASDLLLRAGQRALLLRPGNVVLTALR